MPRKSRSQGKTFPVTQTNPFGIDTCAEQIEPFVVREGTSDRLATRSIPTKLVWSNPERGVWLYHAECLEMMERIAQRYPDGVFDMAFADPPYFLSNGGITCHAGRMVSVDKGDWDKSNGPDESCRF